MSRLLGMLEDLYEECQAVFPSGFTHERFGSALDAVYNEAVRHGVEPTERIEIFKIADELLNRFHRSVDADLIEPLVVVKNDGKLREQYV